MNLNYIYNFKNPIRHFINIDSLNYPNDISSFSTEELCWTTPINFRIKKEGDKYRTLKLPNILSFVRAYHYYNVLPAFNNVNALDTLHKRLSVNLDTGDFISGEYDHQLNQDFMRLCLYDCLLKLDIKEYYGKIYTHYLDLEQHSLHDNILSSLNNGKTSGLIMGNYLSLYFAEYMLSKISEELDLYFSNQNINCVFQYFSDDFYFFCNDNDIPVIIKTFDTVLEQFDFERKESKQEIWDYETYNSYNILTRYWKATVRHWNLEILKDFENRNKKGRMFFHKLSFLNQLIYRLSSLPDEKSKRIFINNFFKTKHFQEHDFSQYTVKDYDYHQLCFLLKLSPESLLYTCTIFKDMEAFDPNKIKPFLHARYVESLKASLNDEQLYYYYALKCFDFEDVLRSESSLVLKSENQILISYYLKDGNFSQSEKAALKLITSEKYWFQNYHLILYCSELMSDLDANIEKYLIPKQALAKLNKKTRYQNFYKDNLINGNFFINELTQVISNIDDYLSLRYDETAVDFDEE